MGDHRARHQEAAQRTVAAGLEVILVVAAIIVDRIPAPTQVMATRRRSPAGRWEFPGGKVEPGEDPTAALRREIVEELGLEIQIGCELTNPVGPSWPISERYEIRTWLAEIVGGTPQPGPDHDLVRWLTLDTVDHIDWLPADRAVVAEIRRLLSSRR